MDWKAMLAEVDLASQITEVVPQVPGLTMHVDGDYLAYYCSGNDDATQQMARQNVLDRIEWFKSRTGAVDTVVHLTTAGSNKGERYLCATTKPYQGKRDGDRKPKNWAYLVGWLQNYEGSAFKIKLWSTREADDGICAVAHFAIGKAPGYAVIATRDKDLRMIPGLHITWLKGETIRVMPGEYAVEDSDEKTYGAKWFWLQMLMGDAVDNIPGLPGYATTNAKKQPVFKPLGEKTAYALLENCETTDEAYEVVAGLYAGFYDPKGECWQDHFCEQASLLWMRCDGKASITDFAHHKGFSRISDGFDDNMWAAVARLEERVRTARHSLNELAA